jgi:hypothetical protein
MDSVCSYLDFSYTVTRQELDIKPGASLCDWEAHNLINLR